MNLALEERRPRIIVVDDDDQMRELVGTRLEATGYDVLSATSGDELLAIISAVEACEPAVMDGVDLIVIDNRMPGTSGIETLWQLRAKRWRTPAILMTAFPGRDVEVQADALGVTLLPKPFKLQALSSAIVRSLQRA